MSCATSQSAWYQDVLGFRETRTGEFPSVGAKFIFLEGNGMQIELISSGKALMPDGGDPPAEPSGNDGLQDPRIRHAEPERADGLSQSQRRPHRLARADARGWFVVDNDS